MIEEVEQFDEKMIDELDRQSNQRIADAFTWERIVTDYENLFKKMKILHYNFRISTPANRWLGLNNAEDLILEQIAQGHQVTAYIRVIFGYFRKK